MPALTEDRSWLPVEQVYLVAVYDEQGGYAATGPMPGPIGFYAEDGGEAPAPVSVGERAEVKLSFDDSIRPPVPDEKPRASAEVLAGAGGIVEIRMYRTRPGQRDRFVQFFEDYTKSERAQVWGRTMPYEGPGGRSYQDIFEEESNRLYDSICSQRVASLAAERPSDKKQAIYQFPIQFKMAVKRLGEFVGALFRPNPFQEQSIFRGFYFTSGTQEGAPIDQIISSLREAMGEE